MEITFDPTKNAVNTRIRLSPVVIDGLNYVPKK